MNVDYSLAKNVKYMGMAFFRPTQLIDLFLNDISVLYSGLPFCVFTVFYEILYIADYLFKEPGGHALVHVLHVSAAQYAFYQIFLFPVVHLADFFVFGGILCMGSRFLRVNVNTVKTTVFFVFIFNTIGLVSTVTDSLTFVWESSLFMYVHPLTGVVFLWYLAAFLTRAGTKKWKSFILSVTGLAVAMGFRLLFLG